MAVLNHLLWLKVRLAGRMRSSALTTVLAVIGVVGSFLFAVAGAVLLVLLVAEGGPDLGRPVMAATLTGLYVGWILAPSLGYRMNDGMNPNLLAHFPARTETLVLGSFLGNFLDPVVLVSCPILVAAVVSGAVLGGNPVHGVLGAFLFLFHAMGTTQTVQVLLIGLLRKRSWRDALLILLPGMLIVGVFALEYKLFRVGELGPSRFTIETARELRWLEYLSTWTPPGLLMEAVMPTTDASVFGSGLACALLLPIALLTVAVAARVVQAALDSGGVEGAEERAAAASRPDRLYEAFRRVVRHPGLAARAAAELRLFCREPQYMLMYLVFLMVFVVLLALESDGGNPATRAATAPALVFASIFVFVGPMFNSLALERQGLRLAFSVPLDPVVYLVAKNLGTWIPVSAAHVVAAVLSCVVLQLSPLDAVLYLVAGQVIIWILLGLGNIASALAPNPLPVMGMVPPRSVSFAQIAVTAVVGSLGITLASLGAGIACLLLFALPKALGGGATSLHLVVLGLAWVGGLYSLSTALGALLVHRRREYILGVLA